LRAAARAHGGDLSALIEALVQELDRQDALKWMLRRADPVDPAAHDRFLEELTGKRTRRRAA
jgi:hypothetical protein